MSTAESHQTHEPVAPRSPMGIPQPQTPPELLELGADRPAEGSRSQPQTPPELLALYAQTELTNSQEAFPEQQELAPEFDGHIIRISWMTWDDAIDYMILPTTRYYKFCSFIK